MAKEIESEKAIEKYCQKVAKDYGGVAVKFSSPSNRGVPDRMLLMPGGRVAFLELKSTGRKPTKLQQYWLDRLNDLGFKATYADTKKSVKEFITSITKWPNRQKDLPIC
jgi:hypothetical protein